LGERLERGTHKKGRRNDGDMGTFKEFAAVDLAGGYFEGYDVALRKESVLDGQVSSRTDRTCASLRSLIGMPIVEVSLPILASCDVKMRLGQGAQVTSSSAL
jgi:hypothetical protein